ncbi:MAG: hypothetical protein OHK0050_06030 [Roseiflexaceae bacterium]
MMVTPDTALPDLPSATTKAGAFVQQLCRAVLSQAAETRANLYSHWQRPLAERVASGRAIAALQVAAVGFDGQLTLRCAQNQSRFREGDMLILHRGDPFADPRLLVTLELDEDTELWVSSDDPALHTAGKIDLTGEWVLDEGFLDLSDAMIDAINQAADSAIGRERILPLLLDEQKTGSDIERYDHAIRRAEEWGLNDEQAEALAGCYANTLAYLIQGPPGTGKTEVLARLAQLLAEDGERVLITAFTHRAINNALNKVATLCARDQAPISVIKIGANARNDDLLCEQAGTFELSSVAEQAGGYILGATPFATRTRRLSGVTFDTVIFDEASQITLPLAIMGMLAGRKFIFIGDQQQLPPVLATRHDDHVLGESVFATLLDRGIDSMLTATYRMNAALTAWPSAQFYAGRLYADISVSARRISYQSAPRRFADILDPEHPAVFVDLGHQYARTHAEPEARLAADLVEELLYAGILASEIGVVVPYRTQSRLIRSLLRQLLPDDRDLRRQVVVDTVERMQGQEREVVIISLTTSDPLFASNLARFLFQPQRLNVAITRPRSKLIVLGSRFLLDAAPAEPQGQEGLACLRSFLEQCQQQVL